MKFQAKNSHHKIGIDLLGNDNDPKGLLSSLIKYFSSHEEDLDLIFFGSQQLETPYKNLISIYGGSNFSFILSSVLSILLRQTLVSVSF